METQYKENEIPKAPPGPVTAESGFADSNVQAKLSPMAPLGAQSQSWEGTQGVTWPESVTWPSCEGGSGHSLDLGSHRGWHRTEKS